MGPSSNYQPLDWSSSPNIFAGTGICAPESQQISSSPGLSNGSWLPNQGGLNLSAISTNGFTNPMDRNLIGNSNSLLTPGMAYDRSQKQKTGGSTKIRHRRGVSAPVGVYSPLALHAPQSIHGWSNQIQATPNQTFSTSSISSRPRHASVSSNDSSLSPIGRNTSRRLRHVSPAPSGTPLSEYLPSPLMGTDPNIPAMSPSQYNFGYGDAPGWNGLLQPSLGFNDKLSATSTPNISTASIFDCVSSPAMYSPTIPTSPKTPHISYASSSALFNHQIGSSALPNPNGLCLPDPWSGQNQQVPPSKMFMNEANNLLSSSPIPSWVSTTVGSPFSRHGASSLSQISSHCAPPSCADTAININNDWMNQSDDCGVTDNGLFDNALTRLSQSSVRADSAMGLDPTSALFDDWAFINTSTRPPGNHSDWMSPAPSMSGRSVKSGKSKHQRHKSQPVNMPSFSVTSATEDGTPIFEPYSVFSEFDSSAPHTPASQHSYPFFNQMDQIPLALAIPIKTEGAPPKIDGSIFSSVSSISPRVNGNSSGLIRTPGKTMTHRSESGKQSAQKCPIYHCTIVCNSEDDYRQHLAMIHGTTRESLNTFLEFLGIDDQSIRRRNALPAHADHRCVYIKGNKPCNASFTRSYDLTRHIATVHAVLTSPWICYQCNPARPLSRHDAHKRHCAKNHPEDYQKKVDNGEWEALSDKKRRHEVS